MPRHARERHDRARRSDERVVVGRSAVEAREHPLLKLQRAAGNRAVTGLVAGSSRSPSLQRALLLRQDTAGGSPEGVQNVPLGQPQPVQVTPAELASGPPAPPSTVTYTGPGSPSSGAATPVAGPAVAPPATAPAAPATTTNVSPPTDDSKAHLDPTITVDPFNVTVTLTVADLHVWRSSHRLVDVDFLADPSASVSVGVDSKHAVAGQAAVNLILVHVKQKGDSVLDLGFGPAVSADGSGATATGQATAELHVTDRASITFTATITPTRNSTGGVDVSSSEVIGAAVHF